MDLPLHDNTKSQVAQYIAQPAHALLLIGAAGVGKTHIAETIAQQILAIPPERLYSHPYVSVVNDKTGSISIDVIRELQRFLQLKTVGTHSIRRVVLVEHADMLTTEAQNAFLKLLEEPPEDTVIILTAANQRALLPTIRSRVQALMVHPPVESSLKDYFMKQGKDAAAITQAYFLSGGLPGLMHALLTDSEHPLTKGVANAKLLLQKPVFERLAMVDSLSKQRDEAVHTVSALQHIAQTGLDQAALRSDAPKIKQWHHILSKSTQALQALGQSSNAKLTLTDLFLQL